jgi:uncharacterized protein
MDIKIPSAEGIQKLFTDYHTPHHVVEHCTVVAHVAKFLAEKAVDVDLEVDLQLVVASALLHDIVRYVDFHLFDPADFSIKPTQEDISFMQKLRKKYEKTHHADAGAEILKEEGFDDIAHIVAQHKFTQISEGFDSFEARIVYYADKRVKHTEVISLQDRLEDGRRRNQPALIGTSAAIEMDAKVFAFEKELCKKLGIKPEEVKVSP